VSEASRAVDDLFAEAEPIAAARGVDLAGGEERRVVGIEQSVSLEGGGEPEQILDRRVPAAGGGAAIRQAVTVRAPWLPPAILV
jgi:hypothetical protein